MIDNPIDPVNSMTVYLTIWASLLLFAAGELGRRRLVVVAASRAWPWWAWAAGIVLCLAHFALAFDLRHGWSQASAIHATALQTRAVYGFEWGGGVFVNYAFLLIWTLDAAWWRLNPLKYAAQSMRLRWSLRTFYFVVIVNGAVIFAAGSRRPLGALIVIAILGSWMSGRSPTPASLRTGA